MELANPLISGPLADPGKDGVNVLLAFALNLEPKLRDSTVMVSGNGTKGLPVVTMTTVAGQPRMMAEFVRRKAVGSPGITYRFEFSSDLGNPSSWVVTGTETAASIDPIWERVTVTDTLPATPARYGRLVVTLP